MELLNNLRIIRKYLWLVLLTTVIAAAGAAVVDRRQHVRTVYIAAARLTLNPSVIHHALANAQSLQQQNRTAPVDLPTLVGTYDQYITSAGFVDEARRRYKLTIPRDQLIGSITTGLIPGTIFYNVNVTGTDQGQIKLAAEALENTFVALDAESTTGLDPDLALTQQETTFWGNRINLLKRRLRQALENYHLAPSRGKINTILTLQGQLGNASAEYQNVVAPTQAQPLAALPGAVFVSVLTRSLIVRNIVLFAALGGLIVGLALALLREYLDHSLRTSEEAAEYLSIPVLAVVNRFRRARRQGAVSVSGGLAAVLPRASGVPGADARALVTVNSPFDAGSEAFYNLHMGILFADAVHTVRAIVVTSAQPGEGKSTVAANLAVVTARAGERVILVDADLRRPILHDLFGLPPAPGLSDLYLAGPNSDIESAARIAASLRQTVVPNLRLLAAGQDAPNPAELLASARTAALLAALREQADVIIVDTPAIGLLADAVILASHADGAILVVRANGPRRDLVRGALHKLTSVNARVLGFVLNMADAPGGRQDRYYRRPQRKTPAATPGDRAAVTLVAPARGDSIRPSTLGVEDSTGV